MDCQNSGHPNADILIVDDTPANLQLLTKMLFDHGYRVRPVPNGALAISAALVEPPDLILLDIKMPDMDGYAVCEKLKQEERTHDIPIIFISAMDATQDKVKAFQVGGLDYITKPFQVEEVLARVETHLTLCSLQKKLQAANTKMMQELTLAGEVQASFLSRVLPELDGWELAVSLEPSRETSGDFYDFSCLPNNHLGILVADVVDKGAGAALFMALSLGLFRTCSLEFPSQPERVLSEVNNRIIENTNANQFLTAFYGIVEPDTGNMTYSNAGHCPPLLFKSKLERDPDRLLRTGFPLGIFDDQTWSRDTRQLDPGDVLVLYSDGVTETQQMDGSFFGEERLIESVLAASGNSAQDIHGSIIAGLRNFMREAPQSDDIVLSVIRREI